MSSVVACSCGKRLKVPAEAVGKQFKCPACGEPIVAPGSPPAEQPASAAPMVAPSNEKIPEPIRGNIPGRVIADKPSSRGVSRKTAILLVAGSAVHVGDVAPIAAYQVGPPGGMFHAVAVSPDGKLLATANGNGTASLFELPAAGDAPGAGTNAPASAAAAP